MEKQFTVNGMMCPRCQARVEKALAAVPGVTACKVDLDAKTATVTLSQEVTDEALMTAIREKGYEPKGPVITL